jgi:probable F420-dependent oxidoreductase
MKVGIHFPQAEIGSDPAVIKDFVQTAEDLGYSHANVPDHVIQTRTARGPLPLSERYTTSYPHHETMTMMAYIAGVTTTFGLKSAIIILPQRPAVLAAKQAAQVDVLSGGRMEMGIGIGWNDPEYEALDMNFKNRARRMEEQMEVMRLLWTEEHVTYSGEFHTINDAGLAPMPIQRPIPIWIGAIAEAAVERAGRLADGWQVIAMDQPGETTEAKFELFRQAAKDAGRDPASLMIEATVFAADDTPDDWAKSASAWADMGATQLVFRTVGDFPKIQADMQAFAPFLKDL